MTTQHFFRWKGWRYIFQWSTTLVICGVVGWMLYSFKVKEFTQAMEEAKAWPEPSETVQVVHSKRASFVPTIDITGQLVAPRQVLLQNELAGQVVAVNFSSGDHAKENDIIVQLDVSEEQANLESAVAQLELATLSLDRISQLVKQKTATRASLDEAQANYKTADASVKRLKSIINKKTIRAPFDGTLGLFQLNTGQFLDVNTEMVVFVGTGQKIWVDFSVPQFYSGPDLDESVEIRPIRHGSVDTSAAEKIEAIIIAKDNVVEANSRSVRYRASIPRRGFRPNEMFEVRVPIGPSQTLVTVPSAALQRDTLGEYLYVLEQVDDQDGFRARRRQVTLKGQTGNVVFLSSGLKEGERVAGLGAFKLRDGMLAHEEQRKSKTSQHGLTTGGIERTTNGGVTLADTADRERG